MPRDKLEHCLHCRESHNLVRTSDEERERCHSVQARRACDEGSTIVTRWQFNLHGRWISSGHTFPGSATHADYEEDARKRPGVCRKVQTLFPADPNTLGAS